MSQNTDRALFYLREWHKHASMPMSLDEFVQYANKYKSFTELFGSSAIIAETTIGSSAVLEKMRELGKLSNGRVTQYEDGSFRGTEFFDILYKGVQSWDLKRIAKTTVEIAGSGIKKIADFGSSALMLYLVVGAIGILIVINNQSKK